MFTPSPRRCMNIQPGEVDPDMRTRNALLRSMRCQGERGFARMSQRWRTLQGVTLSPDKIGDITKPALVLVQFERKMISWKSLRNLTEVSAVTTVMICPAGWADMTWLACLPAVVLPGLPMF